MDNMGKGAILTGKNKEKVYPVTASDLVYDKDTRKNMKETLEEIKQAASSGIEEAPTDGKKYVRKDASWSHLNDDEKCRIILESNQGASDSSSLIGTTVKVTDTSDGTVYLNTTWQGTELSCSIPEGASYKIVCGSIANYATPSTKTFTAEPYGNREAKMVYNTELVTVNLSSDNNNSVVGQNVTINGNQYTWNGTAITQKVAFGKTYTVSVDNKTGYTAPKSQSFTANQNNRNVDMKYKAIVKGVYIQATDGSLVYHSNWANSGKTANGIYVGIDDIAVVMSLEAVGSDFDWGSNTVLIQDILTTSDKNTAYSDVLGDYNTDKIIEQLGDECLAKACKDYIFPNGQNGYLPAAGEWIPIIQNLSTVNDSLAACGYSQITNNTYATSTQASMSTVWYYNFYQSNLSTTNKSNAGNSRPFMKFY